MVNPLHQTLQGQSVADNFSVLVNVSESIQPQTM